MALPAGSFCEGHTIADRPCLVNRDLMGQRFDASCLGNRYLGAAFVDELLILDKHRDFAELAESGLTTRFDETNPISPTVIYPDRSS